MNALTRMNDNHLLHAQFAGPIVMIGFGSIGRGTLPLLERHIGFDRSKFVVIDPVDTDRKLLDERKLRFEQLAITRENYRQVLTPLLTGGPGRGMIINLSVDTSSADLMDALPGDRLPLYRHGLRALARPLQQRQGLDLGALELRVARGRARRAPPPPRRGHDGELLRRQPGHGVLDGQAGPARPRQGPRPQGRRAEDPRGVGAG